MKVVRKKGAAARAWLARRLNQKKHSGMLELSTGLAVGAGDGTTVGVAVWCCVVSGHRSFALG